MFRTRITTCCGSLSQARARKAIRACASQLHTKAQSQRQRPLPLPDGQERAERLAGEHTAGLGHTEPQGPPVAVSLAS